MPFEADPTKMVIQKGSKSWQWKSWKSGSDRLMPDLLQSVAAKILRGRFLEPLVWIISIGLGLCMTSYTDMQLRQSIMNLFCFSLPKHMQLLALMASTVSIWCSIKMFSHSDAQNPLQL